MHSLKKLYNCCLASYHGKTGKPKSPAMTRLPLTARRFVVPGRRSTLLPICCPSVPIRAKKPYCKSLSLRRPMRSQLLRPSCLVYHLQDGSSPQMLCIPRRISCFVLMHWGEKLSSRSKTIIPRFMPILPRTLLILMHPLYRSRPSISIGGVLKSVVSA